MKLTVKVVPGASRTHVAGWLGDVLKVRVAAPPEKGKANAAVLALLARELKLQESALSIISGTAAQRKIIEIHGVTMSRIRATFGADEA